MSLYLGGMRIDGGGGGGAPGLAEIPWSAPSDGPADPQGTVHCRFSRLRKGPTFSPGMAIWEIALSDSLGRGARLLVSVGYNFNSSAAADDARCAVTVTGTDPAIAGGISLGWLPDSSDGFLGIDMWIGCAHLAHICVRPVTAGLDAAIAEPAGARFFHADPGYNRLTRLCVQVPAADPAPASGPRPAWRTWFGRSLYRSVFTGTVTAAAGAESVVTLAAGGGLDEVIGFGGSFLTGAGFPGVNRYPLGWFSDGVYGYVQSPTYNDSLAFISKAPGERSGDASDSLYRIWVEHTFTHI
jgi:hypothetical protein